MIFDRIIIDTFRMRWPCAFFTIFLLNYSLSAFSQSPLNIGFESGAFNGWSAATGSCCPFNLSSSGFDSTRHKIVSGSGTDPNSLNVITQVCTGSLYSAKLGNDSTHARSEQLQYEFVVPNTPTLLLVQFAIILENHQHPQAKQPRFKYQLKNKYGTDLGCSEEFIAGESGIPYQNNGIIQYLPWSDALIDLRLYSGDTLILEFTSGDCQPGGHFGYAYVDASLIPAEISSTFCLPNGDALLSVPEGFNTSWNTGDTSSTITVPAGMYLDSYEAVIEGDYGCPISLNQTVSNILPKANFTIDDNCSLTAYFDNSSLNADTSKFNWQFGDGANSQIINPVHTYTSAGPYAVTLTAYGYNGCMDTITYEIIAGSDLSVIPELPEICTQDQSVFTATGYSTFSHQFTYEWTIGTFNTSDQSFTNYFNESGQFPLSLTVTDEYECSYTYQSLIDVKEKVECDTENDFYIPNAFTPDGNGINDTWGVVTDQNNSSQFLTLHDRWGKLIFSSDIKGAQWDGKLPSNSLAPEGVYIYTFQIGTRLEKGTLLLYR